MFFLPSGEIRVQATDGELTVAGVLDVAGQARTFFDATRFSDAGSIFLRSDRADVVLLTNSVINVAGVEAGQAGTLSVSASEGTLRSEGSLLGGAEQALGASFVLDAGHLNQGDLGNLDRLLNASGFDRSRDLRIRNGDVLVSADVRSSEYLVTADSGNVTFAATVDASGKVGGFITAHASGHVVVGSGTRLDVSGLDFNNAGRGGRVVLEAGAPVAGAVDSGASVELQSGAEIDLSVAAAANQPLRPDQFTGTLVLRAPVTADGSPQVAPIGADIKDAALVVIQGHQILDISGTNGDLTPAVRQQHWI
ncbi:MAG: autotransporter adhesin family protein [Verrucomicrobia bacterium]|nr:autotransporter adhesin family protein [Verrucomicrobiota bacterium]